MMSLATIRQLSRDAGRSAERKRKTPYHPESIEDLDTGLRGMPFLGDYDPKGWTRTNTQWFVDASGFGSEGEAALTYPQFIRAAREHFATHPTAGFGITEQGQFQVYVTAFEYTGKSGRSSKTQDIAA